jgi:rhodanese-related sulfurtransferase
LLIIKYNKYFLYQINIAMIDDLTPQEFQKSIVDEGNILIDVREESELDICQIDGAINMPMSSITETFSDLDPSLSYSIYCHHGMRSMQVANFLLSKGFHSLFNLRGGIDAWSREIDNSVEQY